MKRIIFLFAVLFLPWSSVIALNSINVIDNIIFDSYPAADLVFVSVSDESASITESEAISCMHFDAPDTVANENSNSAWINLFEMDLILDLDYRRVKDNAMIDYREIELAEYIGGDHVPAEIVW